MGIGDWGPVRLQLHPAALERDGDVPPILGLHIPKRPGEALPEGKPGEGFQNVVHRPHLIALDGVLRRVGDEHDHHVLIHLPHPLRRLHAVHEGHLYVHQYQVIVGGVVRHQVLAVPELGQLKPRVPLRLVAAQALFQQRQILVAVLDNRDSQRPVHRIRLHACGAQNQK